MKLNDKSKLQEVRYFLNERPNETFMEGTFGSENKDGSFCGCSLGQINFFTSGNRVDSILGDRLSDLSESFMYNFHETEGNIISVNDGDNLVYYPQTTPKARVLALLDDMIKAGYQL